MALKFKPTHSTVLLFSSIFTLGLFAAAPENKVIKAFE